MPKVARSAKEIVSEPASIDDYKAPLLFMYDITYDGTGDSTAYALNILFKRGWMPILMTSSPNVKGIGAGYIYTVLQRVEKPKRESIADKLRHDTDE